MKLEEIKNTVKIQLCSLEKIYFKPDLILEFGDNSSDRVFEIINYNFKDSTHLYSNDNIILYFERLDSISRFTMVYIIKCNKMTKTSLQWEKKIEELFPITYSRNTIGRVYSSVDYIVKMHSQAKIKLIDLKSGRKIKQLNFDFYLIYLDVELGNNWNKEDIIKLKSNYDFYNYIANEFSGEIEKGLPVLEEWLTYRGM